MSGRAIKASVVGFVAATALTLAFATGGSSAQEAKKSQAGRSVAIRLAEFNIGGTTRLPSGGDYTFRLWNAGNFPHNFVVLMGPTKFKSETLQRGGKQELKVSLKPGAYLAVCQVREGGHMNSGMVHTFTVGTQDQQTGQWR